MSTAADQDAMTIQIIADGTFGGDVAGHLAGLVGPLDVTTRVVSDADSGRLADLFASGPVIRASWRDVRAEFEEVAVAAVEAGRPWLPVVLAHPHIRVGPVLLPDRGPCHACYRARSRQHSTTESEQVNDERDRQRLQDRALGVAGYPPHVAALAAGLALGMVQSAAGGDGQAWAGRVSEINYVTDEVEVWHVVPVHGCPQCHPDSRRQAAAKTRTKQIRALARTLPSGSDERD